MSKLHFILSLLFYFVSLFVSQSSCGLSSQDLNRIPPPEETARKFRRHFFGIRDEHFNSHRIKRQTYKNFFDVIYAIDASSSISPYEFQKGLQAIQRIILKSRASTRHALVTIATEGNIALNLSTNDYATRSLRALKRIGGKTNTQDALGKCFEMFTNSEYGVRKGSFRRVLVVSDGQSNIKRHLTLQRALELRKSGIDVFIIAVGEYLEGIRELSSMASTPGAHMYRVKDIDGLALVVKLITNTLTRLSSIFSKRKLRTTPELPAQL